MTTQTIGSHFRGSIILSLLLLLILRPNVSFGDDQDRRHFAVIAYFHGDTTNLSQFPLDKLTHICYSFAHLKGNTLSLNNAKDTLTLRYLVSFKKSIPNLKILLSLGGWGGCPSCSDVFSTDSGRFDFSQSTLRLLEYFRIDGIDLDWEYPSVEGYPGHRFTPDDRHNFTLLARTLRKTLGNKYEITFASGAFTDCLRESIEWNEVMPYVDRVQLMTYDLVNGNSTVTGHHTPLFSTPSQNESTDNAVRFLDSVGVPPGKIAIGLAFYARVWTEVENKNNGLYQSGKFLRSVAYKGFEDYFNRESGFVYHWDSTACAPFMYSASKKLFGTFDNRRSITLKTSYALSHHLGGVMYWELKGDTYNDSLLDAIDNVLRTTEHTMPDSQ